MTDAKNKTSINFALLESCPKCESPWKADPVPEKDRWMYGDIEFFSRVIGISSWVEDRTVAWQCPDCHTCWDRDTGKIRKSFDLGLSRPSA